MYIADFHLHSRHSRATSRNMNVADLAAWARRKGISLLGTGDFTHYVWFHELRETLRPTDREGVYEYGGVDFLPTAEICNLFEHGGRSRRMHSMIFASSLERAGAVNRALEQYGDMNADGRPMLRISGRDLVHLVKENDEAGFVVPAHIWTPHFSLFGSNGGFDRIEECFGDMTGEIPALETGLSSDPPMNRRVSALDGFCLISNSDAHSPDKLGREANVFRAPFDIRSLAGILRRRDAGEFLFTAEYFPEEGKYHFDGHRSCKVRMSPEETRERKGICPACGRKVTVGVMHRVMELADRPGDAMPPGAIPYRRLVPLVQIVACALGRSPDSAGVEQAYLDIVQNVAPEFPVLLDADPDGLRRRVPGPIVDAIVRARNGDVTVEPGYDGEFGTVGIVSDHGDGADQQALF